MVLTTDSGRLLAGQLGDVDDRGLGLLDPRDRRGSKNAYIDLAQKLALEACLSFTGGETVLDYACGNGRLTRWLAQRAGCVVGADPSARLLRAGRAADSHSNSLYVGVERSGLPFRDGCFDALLCVGLLRRLERPRIAGVLAEFGRVLKPGGRMFCVEKCYRTSRPDHLGPEECVELLSASGFERIEGYPFRKGHWLPLYLIRFGLLPRRWWDALAPLRNQPAPAPTPEPVGLLPLPLPVPAPGGWGTSGATVNAGELAVSCGRPPVVILGAGSNITTLAAARCFTQVDVPVLVLDSDGHTALLSRSRHVHRVYPCGALPHDPQGFLRRLERLGRTLRREVGDRVLLLPTHDTGLHLCAENLGDLRRCFVLPGDPGREELLRFFDKARFFAALGEPVGHAPPTLWFAAPEQLRSAAGEFTYPVILKPAYKDVGQQHARTWKAKAVRVRGPAELVQRTHAFFPPAGLIVQEYLDCPEGEEVCWWGYRKHDGTITGMTACEMHKYPRVGGTGTLVRSQLVPEVDTRAREILTRLDFHGLCELPFLPDRSTGQYLVLECNPRCWLQLGLMWRCGLNAPLQAYQEHTGIDCGAGGETALDGLTWISPEYDLLRCLFAPSTEPLYVRLRQWCRDLRAADEVALWDLDEPAVVLAHVLLHARRAGRSLLQVSGCHAQPAG